jgi:hypothetical protein
MTSRTFLRLCPAALALAVLGVAGCNNNPSTLRVSGVLQWEDGTPISGANVRFVPTAQGGHDALGYTGKDGDFTLSSFSDADGAIPGEYTVVVTKTVASPTFAGGAPSPNDPKALAEAMKKFEQQGKGATKVAKDPIPEAYRNEKTSPLKWKVESGNTNPKLTVRK